MPKTSCQSRPLDGCSAGLLLAVGAFIASSSHTVAQPASATTTTVSSSWVILPSEDVIYRYYPKYQQDHGIAGVAEINCRVRDRRDLDQCLIRSETPEHNGFGPAAVRMAEAEFHVLPEPAAGTDVQGTVSIRVAFTPKLAAGSEAAVAASATTTAAAGAEDPAAVIAWGEAVKPLDWHYAAPASGQISFWKVQGRLSPTRVRGTVRYEYYARADAPSATVRSAVVDYEFDCAGHGYRPLGVTTYVQPNLAGPPTVVSGPDAASRMLVAGTVLEDAASRVCQFDAGGGAGTGSGAGTPKMDATSASPSKP